MAQAFSKTSKIFQKRDKVLILAIVVIAAALSFGMWFLQRNMGEKIRITIDGNVYGEYALSKDQVIDIDRTQGHNRLVIANGSAYMSEADCPDHYCMEYSPISKENEVIVCLPHKLVAEVVGQGKTVEEVPDVIVQ